MRNLFALFFPLIAYTLRFAEVKNITWTTDNLDKAWDNKGLFLKELLQMNVYKEAWIIIFFHGLLF